MVIKNVTMRIGCGYIRFITCIVAMLLYTTSGQADDWPQWRGPNYDGISRETGLVDGWTEGGPQELWRIQIVVFTGVAVVGVRPKDGAELWRFPWRTNEDASVAQPIFYGNRLFISSGFDSGAAMLELTVRDGQTTVNELWKSRRMKNFMSSCILVDGHLYGFSSTMLTCMDFQTGEVKWIQRGFGRGSLLAADGKLIIYGERAKLVLAEISPESFKQLAAANVLSGKTWTVPTLSNGKLFVRNEEELVCLKFTP